MNRFPPAAALLPMVFAVSLAGCAASAPSTTGHPVVARIAASAIAAHVSTFRDARFGLQSLRQIDPRQLELRWRAGWQERKLAVDYVDMITLDGG